MIEVEKKFKLTKEQEKKLLEGAEFVGEKTFTDIYYDNAQFSLSTQDMWLREREGNFELKIPMHQDRDKSVDQYDEIVGENAIREIFAIFPHGTFQEDLATLGHQPYCKCVTKRKKYHKEGFVLDLDEVEFSGTDLKYAIAEIELLVKDKEDAAVAVEKVIDFALKHDLKVEPLLGKVGTYLKEKKPQHYEALIASGVLAGTEL